jgi:hypothetical protein
MKIVEIFVCMNGFIFVTLSSILLIKYQRKFVIKISLQKDLKSSKEKTLLLRIGI